MKKIDAHSHIGTFGGWAGVAFTKEKLIEQMKWWAEECDRTNFGCQAKKTLQEGICGLSTLQAENERLKNKLSELAHFPFDEPGIGERTRLMAENAELRAELEQVKRENETLKHALQNWHEEV